MDDLEKIAKSIHLHRDEDHEAIRSRLQGLRPADAAEVLNLVPSLGEAAEMLGLVSPDTAIAVLEQPTLERREKLVSQLPSERAAQLLEGMAADQRTAIMRNLSEHCRRLLLPMLSGKARMEVERQLQYREGTAGELMTTEFVRLDPSMQVAQALDHIRQVAKSRETIYACYVVEPGSSRLQGVVSLRDLVMAKPNRPITEVMRPHPVTATVDEPQKDLSRKFSKYNLLAVPVLETDGRLVGFVTVDDIIDAIVDIQTDTVLRMGGVEAGALDDPYLATPWPTLVKKRATWLVILFLGEMLTATAMGHFEGEIAKAVVLALFVPLIISSGGNSGSQATSLLIRALALGEVRLGQWLRVFARELVSGFSLGVILGAIGMLRITVWQGLGWSNYGEHWFLVALTVGLSLVGIVLWGSISGAMLPFILKRVGLDPATSSAPFVATLVDVTGLIIYFTVAQIVLHGTLL
jgi:magnesium transporter